MTQKGQIYKCEKCGNVVKVLEAGGGQLVCCGQPMNLIGSEAEVSDTHKNKEEESKKNNPSVCGRCGYIYDPKKGDKKGKIPAGVCFEDLNEEWVCPLCGASKKHFSEMLGYE